MAFDFPSSPTVGQRFSPVGGVTYTWNGYSWDGGSGMLLISDTAPTSPTNGSLWWESDTGTLWIYYTDANSSQWVMASGGNMQSKLGRTDGSNPAAGEIGEYMQAGPFATSGMGASTTYNLGVLSLPPGDWDVWGQSQYVNATPTVFAYLGLSTASASLNLGWLTSGYTGGGGDFYASVRPGRLNTSSTTSVYLVGYCLSNFDFSNTFIMARRMS